MATVDTAKLTEVAQRIREMREIFGFTEEEMAKRTEVSLTDYRAYESGAQDFPFTFIHKCSLAFDIGIMPIRPTKPARSVAFNFCLACALILLKMFTPGSLVGSCGDLQSNMGSTIPLKSSSRSNNELPISNTCSFFSIMGKNCGSIIGRT